MRTLLSQRRARFYALIRSADKESSLFLARTLERHQQAMSALQRLAILRVLVCRDYGLSERDGIGWPYPQRKRRVRQILGV